MSRERYQDFSKEEKNKNNQYASEESFKRGEKQNAKIRYFYELLKMT